MVLSFKWIGYPFVNVELQILWRLIIAQWLIAGTYWVWDFDFIWKLQWHTAEHNQIYI